jgi:hypothetical protein
MLISKDACPAMSSSLISIPDLGASKIDEAPLKWKERTEEDYLEPLDHHAYYPIHAHAVVRAALRSGPSG